MNIGGQSFRPTLRDGVLYVSVPRDSFAGGEYFVFFQLKGGNIVPDDTKVTFAYATGSINIAHITPSTISSTSDQFIVAQGNGFGRIVSIQLNNSLILQNAQFQIINDRVLAVRIPKGLPAGQYFLNIMDTESISEIRNVSFTITE